MLCVDQHKYLEQMLNNELRVIMRSCHRPLHPQLTKRRLETSTKYIWSNGDFQFKNAFPLFKTTISLRSARIT